MITLTPKYIEDSSGNKMVILPKEQFEYILEELEALDDIKKYDEAKQKQQEFIVAEEAFTQIEIQRKK